VSGCAEFADRHWALRHIPDGESDDARAHPAPRTHGSLNARSLKPADAVRAWSCREVPADRVWR
jgi:hypothetical protein